MNGIGPSIGRSVYLLRRSWYNKGKKSLLKMLRYWKNCVPEQRYTVYPWRCPPEEKEQLNHLGGCGNVLKMMGIPNFRGKDLQHMQQFWKTERRKRMKQSAAKKEN